MIHLTVTTVERIVLHEDDVIQISLPTMSGEITILPNHVPMLSVISQGEMRIEQVAGGDISWFVSGGMVLVDQETDFTRVEILTDLAERAADLDTAEIEEARRRAEKLLAEKPINVDLAKVEAALQREMARLRLAQKKQKRSGAQGTESSEL